MTKCRAQEDSKEMQEDPERCGFPNSIHLTHGNFKVIFNYFQTEF